MKELKTLKDFESFVCHEDANIGVELLKGLKQEAINHIKNNESVKPLPKFRIPTGGRIKFPKRVNELSFDDEMSKSFGN